MNININCYLINHTLPPFIKASSDLQEFQSFRDKDFISKKLTETMCFLFHSFQLLIIRVILQPLD